MYKLKVHTGAIKVKAHKCRLRSTARAECSVKTLLEMQQPGGLVAANATNMANPVGIFNGSLPEYVRVYSPLMLCNEWPRVARLLFVLFCAVFGSLLNGFYISSFFVEHALMKIGCIYLACAGIADILITGGVMPMSAVILLSGQWDNPIICRAMQVIAETATYAYSFFYLMVAVENYYRVCRTSAEYNLITNIGIAYVSILIFFFSFSLATGGVLMGLDYDYCERLSYGSTSFRITTSVLFHGMCTILTLYFFIVAILNVRRRSREQANYKRTRLYRREHSLVAINLTAYILFIVAWIPYVIIVNEFPSTSDALYYNTVWIGLIRSVFTSFIYGITNRNFRRAYAHIFNYCCCKSNLSSSYASRHRKTVEFKSVHIILSQAVNSNSPYRAASTSTETYEL